MTAHCVVTTINQPSQAVQELERRFGENLIVVGDLKTPNIKCGASTFVSYETQINESPLSLTKFLPVNHYARKNLGYLLAMHRGASSIYESDDDNIPNDKWKLREETCKADLVCTHDWLNVYRRFCGTDVWPRGFPLSRVRDFPLLDERRLVKGTQVKSPVQQGLADGDPDVDAIYRLVMPKRGTRFTKTESIALNHSWCPFNSQTTWWFPEAYPLMYLPIHATFRMTDIWRSFIAQRCLWENDAQVTFHSPSEVYQERNAHNLLKDFADELPGYLHNEEICKMLEKLPLVPGETLKNLRTCYAGMISHGFLLKEEMLGVDAWIADITALKGLT
jgi:hypothetical protein